MPEAPGTGVIQYFHHMWEKLKRDEKQMTDPMWSAICSMENPVKKT
jgi:hypothetical protein